MLRKVETSQVNKKQRCCSPVCSTIAFWAQYCQLLLPYSRCIPSSSLPFTFVDTFNLNWAKPMRHSVQESQSPFLQFWVSSTFLYSFHASVRLLRFSENFASDNYNYADHFMLDLPKKQSTKKMENFFRTSTFKYRFNVISYHAADPISYQKALVVSHGKSTQVQNIKR